MCEHQFRKSVECKCGSLFRSNQQWCSVTPSVLHRWLYQAKTLGHRAMDVEAITIGYTHKDQTAQSNATHGMSIRIVDTLVTGDSRVVANANPAVSHMQVPWTLHIRSQPMSLQKVTIDL